MLNLPSVKLKMTFSQRHGNMLPLKDHVSIWQRMPFCKQMVEIQIVISSQQVMNHSAMYWHCTVYHLCICWFTIEIQFICHCQCVPKIIYKHNLWQSRNSLDQIMFSWIGVWNWHITMYVSIQHCSKTMFRQYIYKPPMYNRWMEFCKHINIYRQKWNTETFVQFEPAAIYFPLTGYLFNENCVNCSDVVYSISRN
jgi:hypothetical protein